MSSQRGAGESFAAWFARRLSALADRTPERVPLDLLPSAFKAASVLAPFWAGPGDSVQLALTLRPTTLSSHKGQIALPGGRRDPGDRDEAATALRETHEELGIAPDQVRVLARLDDAWSVQGYLVAPIVGWLDRPPELVPSPGEVERVIVADVERLMDPRIYVARTAHHAGQTWTMHSFDYDGDVIWGMTGGILDRLFRLVRGEEIPEDSAGAASLRRYLEQERS